MSNDQLPMTNYQQQPITNSQQPTANSQQLTANSQPPIDQSPFINHQWPTTNNQFPMPITCKIISRPYRASILHSLQPRPREALSLGWYITPLQG